MPPTITVRVHVALYKRGARKRVITPQGDPWTPQMPRTDTALVKAIARAFRWRKLLETGDYGTIEELAKAEKINTSYVSRILRLTLLAPQIVEAIVDGRQAYHLQLEKMLDAFAANWGEQTATLQRLPDL